MTAHPMIASDVSAFLDVLARLGYEEDENMAGLSGRYLRYDDGHVGSLVSIDGLNTQVHAGFEWDRDPASLYELTFTLTTPTALAAGTIQRALALRLRD
jgi:hypothetical protein